MTEGSVVGLGQSMHPPSCYDERAVKLPNGCWLEPGGRVRVPNDVPWIPEVMAAAEEHGWYLETGAASSSSEVICWPRNA